MLTVNWKKITISMSLILKSAMLSQTGHKSFASSLMVRMYYMGVLFIGYFPWLRFEILDFPMLCEMMTYLPATQNELFPRDSITRQRLNEINLNTIPPLMSDINWMLTHEFNWSNVSPHHKVNTEFWVESVHAFVSRYWILH